MNTNRVTVVVLEVPSAAADERAVASLVVAPCCSVLNWDGVWVDGDGGGGEVLCARGTQEGGGGEEER